MDRVALIPTDGIAMLAEATRKMIRTKKDQEAEELYREDGKQGGLLSRQRGHLVQGASLPQGIFKS